jgi:hypothetical protein
VVPGTKSQTSSTWRIRSLKAASPLTPSIRMTKATSLRLAKPGRPEGRTSARCREGSRLTESATLQNFRPPGAAVTSFSRPAYSPCRDDAEGGEAFFGPSPSVWRYRRPWRSGRKVKPHFYGRSPAPTMGRGDNRRPGGRAKGKRPASTGVGRASLQKPQGSRSQL